MTSATLERLLHTIREVYGIEGGSPAADASVRFVFEANGFISVTAGLRAAPRPGGRQDEHFVVYAQADGEGVDAAFDALWSEVQKRVGAERDKAEKAARAAGLTPYSVEVKF